MISFIFSFAGNAWELIILLELAIDQRFFFDYHEVNNLIPICFLFVRLKERLDQFLLLKRLINNVQTIS